MVSARRRELGQNFLVDRNILDVIERLAALSADDVVLEVGGGAGVLSQRLAALAGWVHVIELDERLRPRLTEAVAGFSNVDLVFGDATVVELATLSPPPTRMVANLPYGVAATVILRTILELPALSSWVVMVQREVGERFAAGPGSGVYGVPSVLAQLSCEVRVLRPVSRTVFRPVPNVDSVLLGLRRRDGEAGAPPARALVDLVHGAFAHRRKALAGSLALTGYGGGGPSVRARARSALGELGLPADARAERLSPDEFRALAERLSR
jgi:16S rRNA (adenine1518-N6/adenine1519-N6)-dimethyltransferase